MKIKKIKKLSSGKYQVVLENGEKFLTYDEIIIKKNILYKNDLTDIDIEEINKSNNYYDIYNASVKFLSKRLHSYKEFEKFIERYQLNKSEKTRLIEDMKNIRLLNDSNFLSAYVIDRIRLSNDGPLKIKSDLLKHNILEKDIDAEISKISKEEVLNKANKLILKKMKSLKGSNYYIKQKIYLYMENLGFAREIIDECMTDEVDETDSLENDFNKYYNLYSKKEKDSNKLYLKIKQKLYQKGYSLSRIDEIIEKKRI